MAVFGGRHDGDVVERAGHQPDDVGAARDVRQLDVASGINGILKCIKNC